METESVISVDEIKIKSESAEQANDDAYDLLHQKSPVFFDLYERKSELKKIVAGTRTDTMAWLKQQGYAVTPSESNCFMLDTRRPGKQVLEAMASKDVYVGRIWPSWPTQVRITVGTPDEMLAFRNAFTEVMNS